MKRRTILFYTAATFAFAAIVGFTIFTFINLGNFENAFAGTSYSSAASGPWTTNSTWSGGSAPPTTNITNTITINSNHYVTSTSLSVSNGAVFNIQSSATLYINGDLVVKNNFTLNVSGTLIITGNLVTQNNASMLINGGGVVKISGNASFDNNTVLTVNGNLAVSGTLSFGSNPTFNGSGTVSTSSGCASWTGTGSCSLGSLPVKLLNFDAENSDGKVKLTWRTASEENNDFFTIERSSDGKTFEAIGKVQGSGTTIKAVNYEFEDANAEAGRNYYRLSQTDYDGKTETFPAITIDVSDSNAEAETMQIYPNPLTGTVLTVSFSNAKDGALEVMDSRGNSIFSQQVNAGENNIELFLNENLTPGVYFVNYQAGKVRKIVRLIKK